MVRQEPNKLDASQRRRSFDEVYRAMAPHQAIMESARCLFCDNAPCNSACPSGIDVAAFIRNIKVRNFVGAARKIREKNILAITCGRVCPAEKFCEAKCISTQLTEPINIKALHRFASDFELSRGLKPPEITSSKSDRVIVIGSGPSGLSCAAELGRLGYGVTVFEELPVTGGILAYGIPPHKLPKRVVQAEIDYITRMNVHVELNSSVIGSSTIDELLEQGYGAIFVGVGLGKPVRLSVPGENMRGVYNWKEVLFWLNIHDAQTTRQGAINLGEQVAVVGGGNVAIDVATSALRLGAQEVYLICLEAIEEMPAFKSEITDALEEGVIIRPRSKVLSIIGDEDGKVRGVECTGTAWKKANDFSPENAVPVTGSNFRLRVNSVVEAIGQSLDQDRNQFLSGLDMREGHLIVNPETGETSRRGVFAGGDALRGGGTVVQSVRDGVIAARGIDKYLQGNGAK